MLTEITLSNATNKTVLLNGQIRKFTGLDLADQPDCQGAATSDGHRFTAADMKPGRSLEDLRDAMMQYDAIVGRGLRRRTGTDHPRNPVPAAPVGGDDAAALADKSCMAGWRCRRC